MNEGRVRRLADGVAGRLAQIDGVVAVALGGSWARGEAHPDSDVDLGIYYRGSDPPEIARLRALARELDDRHPQDAVTGFGEWGPWIDGGGWLTIQGQRVDWLYRDLDRVEGVMAECRDGRPAVHYQPGHPHGFHTHTYLGEVALCRVLQDTDVHLATLRRSATQYPEPLRRAVIRTQLWEAGFALETARKPASRGDAFYVGGCLFRCAACLVQTLFALNRRYVINEKGSVAAASRLPSSPDGFAATVHAVLSCPGETPEGLVRSIERFEGLRASTERLCAEASVPGA